MNRGVIQIGKYSIPCISSPVVPAGTVLLVHPGQVNEVVFTLEAMEEAGVVIQSKTIAEAAFEPSPIGRLIVREFLPSDALSRVTIRYQPVAREQGIITNIQPRARKKAAKPKRIAGGKKIARRVRLREKGKSHGDHSMP